MTKQEVTPEQLVTIRAALLVTVQVASRQKVGIKEPPKLEDPQAVLEACREVSQSIGFIEGVGFGKVE